MRSGDDRTTFRGDRRRLHVEFRHGRTAAQRSEVLRDEPLHLGRLEITDDREARVVRRIEGPEELLHVIELHGLDVLVRADDVRVVGVTLREQQVEQLFLHDAVGLVLDGLAALVAHDVLLVRQGALVEHVQQVAHAVRFEPKRELELVGRQGLEIIRAVEVGRAVDVAGAGALEQLEVRIARYVPGALEHHVLEQVREARPSRVFVGGTDVIPEVDGDHGQSPILRQDDFEAVRQRVFLERDVRDVGDRRGGGPRRCRRRGTSEHRDCGEEAQDRDGKHGCAHGSPSLETVSEPGRRSPGNVRPQN